MLMPPNDTPSTSDTHADERDIHALPDTQTLPLRPASVSR
jgi:hypothetical protein